MAAVEEAFARFSSTASSTSDLPTKTYYVNSIDGLSRGKKYFVSGWCSGRILNMFVDSGAEISCIPRRCVPHETLIPLERPVQVAGFRDKDSVKVTHRVEISIYYGPGVLKASFYVVDTPFPIIGTDLLYDKSKRISLVTGREAFRVGDEMLFTKPDPLSAREEYKRRKL